MWWKDLIEPGNLEHLPNQPGQPAESQITALVAQFLCDRDHRTQPHAADVGEIGQINDQSPAPVCNAGFALPFKLNSILGIHAADDMQDDFFPNLRPFKSHG